MHSNSDSTTGFLKKMSFFIPILVKVLFFWGGLKAPLRRAGRSDFKNSKNPHKKNGGPNPHLKFQHSTQLESV